MAERRPSLMDPRIEQLLNRVDSKFTLVTLAAMRAREINDYYNQLGEGLGRIVPPQVTSVSRKPLSIALEEVAASKIEFERIEPVADGEAQGDEAPSVDADAAPSPDEPLEPGA
jgi:DNA-directed RNA polymerase subunit omega